jgi:transcriptional regulator with XRE-family HTH domain
VPRPHRPVPAEVVREWPNRPSEQAEVEVARQFAINLRAALEGRSLRQAKALTGVDHTTIAAILNGTVWPDLHTLARLEHGLDADLWPVGAARQP